MMILALRKKQLLSLLLLFIAIILCPGTLRAEATPWLNLKVAGLSSPLPGCPITSEMRSFNSFFGSPKNFYAILKAIHNRIIHKSSCESDNFKSLLMNYENLLLIGSSRFLLVFLSKSVENGAIFLVAVFVIYNPLFRGEREVEK
jgi:hypothetical protein